MTSLISIHILIHIIISVITENTILFLFKSTYHGNQQLNEKDQDTKEKVLLAGIFTSNMSNVLTTPLHI